MEEFDVPVEPVLRKYWNESAGTYENVYISTLFHDGSVGLDFVDQLTVDDEERAATLVAVSTKLVYAHFNCRYCN